MVRTEKRSERRLTISFSTGLSNFFFHHLNWIVKVFHHHVTEFYFHHESKKQETSFLVFVLILSLRFIAKLRFPDSSSFLHD